ncbi:MAG: serine/threonine protein kinase [Myxococcales bacterium]|nr:serine/threonine protein kinase [Myxococcales bacterium]
MTRDADKHRSYKSGDVVADRYELLERLGDGATGVVFRARDLYVDGPREVLAVKLVHPRLLKDPQISGRFRREARILAELDHSNVCRIFEAVTGDDFMLLALEYIEGTVLERYLAEHGPLPFDEALALIEQLCAALTAAHALGIAHRDLKPGNVIVEGAQHAGGSFRIGLRAKVVDFGLAKLLGQGSLGTSLTTEHMVIGTPEYMSPEQIKGEPADHRADIYSLGIMLYEVLTGSVPFRAATALATMAMHLQEPPPRLRDVASARAVPESVERALTKALSKLPEQRFDSATELAESLRSAMRAEVEAHERADAETHESHARMSDTLLDRRRPEGATLQSPRDAALDAHVQKRGAKVTVLVENEHGSPSMPAVREAADPKRSQTGIESRSSARAAERERRLWRVAFVAMMCGAIIAGVWLGLR